MKTPNGGGTSGTHGNGSTGKSIQTNADTIGTESAKPNGGGASGTLGNGSAGMQKPIDSETESAKPNGGGASGTLGNGSAG